MLTKQGAEVSRVATPKEAVGAIASYLGTCNLPPQIRIGADPVLAALPWREAWDIERSFGRAAPDDRAALSRRERWPRPRPGLCSWCPAPTTRPP